MRYEGKHLPAWVRLRPRKPRQPLPALSDVVTTVLRAQSRALMDNPFFMWSVGLGQMPTMPSQAKR